MISNCSRFGSSGVSVADRLPEPRRFEVPPLAADGERRIEAPLAFARRGVYELGPAEVRDPFGLMRFVRGFSERTEVVVYPGSTSCATSPSAAGTSRSARGARVAGGATSSPA